MIYPIRVILGALSNRLTHTNNKIEAKQGILPELLMLVFYITAMVIVSAFHEPWFDEAQSWMIARCASIKEILTVIPHFEGHPPLWHLLLVPFAKSGIPYELGLKTVSLLLASSAMGLVIFRSPFPRILRLTIPFTYFFFYQYGVISRCYSLMTLGFMLAAMLYKTRNEKPFRYITALAVICGSSAYGLAITAGLCLVWLYEILKEKSLPEFLRVFLKDKRIRAMLILLAFAIYIVIVITPYKDAYALSLTENNSLFDRLVYLLVIAPADSIFYSCFLKYGFLAERQVWDISFIIGIIVGLLFWVYLLMHALRSKKLLALILPYSFFVVFSAAVYFNTYHLGIAALYLLFWFWITCDVKTGPNVLPNRFHKLIHRRTDLLLLKRLSVCFISFCVLVSLYWTVIASLNEIIHNYGFGRDVSEFIKGNNLINSNIFSGWKIETTINSDKYIKSTDKIDTYLVYGVDILPYFSKNIISNLNGGSNEYGYLIHRTANDSENVTNFQNWAEKGLPDIILGYMPDMKTVYGNAFSADDYILVKEIEKSFIWKDHNVSETYCYIFVRKELALKLGLQEIVPSILVSSE